MAVSKRGRQSCDFHIGDGEINQVQKCNYLSNRMTECVTHRSIGIDDDFQKMSKVLRDQKNALRSSDGLLCNI